MTVSQYTTGHTQDGRADAVLLCFFLRGNPAFYDMETRSEPTARSEELLSGSPTEQQLPTTTEATRKDAEGDAPLETSPFLRSRSGRRASSAARPAHRLDEARSARSR